VTESQATSQPPAAARPGADDEIDLLDYLRVIWRYRRMIVVLCGLAMVATVVLTMLQPRRYQASATIVPPLDVLQRQSSLSGGLGGLGGLGGAMLRGVTSSGSVTSVYVEILQSREVADVLVDRFDLMNVYKRVPTRADARRELGKNTRIETTTDGAVKIAVTDLDPNRCAALATAYVEELDRRNRLLSVGEATSKRVFLENRLKEVEARLSKIDQLPSREARIQEMIYQTLVQECELAKMEEAKSMPTIQVLDRPVPPELGVPRGTVRKGVLAGVAAGMLGVFVAFTREYVVQARRTAPGPHVRAGGPTVAPADST